MSIAFVLFHQMHFTVTVFLLLSLLFGGGNEAAAAADGFVAIVLSCCLLFAFSVWDLQRFQSELARETESGARLECTNSNVTIKPPSFLPT